MYNFNNQKVHWATPEILAEVTWDYVSDESNESRLVDKAIKSTLTNYEEFMLIEALKNTPERAFEWGINPDVMPAIIDTYTQLACHIFCALNSFPSIKEYLLLLS